MNAYSVELLWSRLAAVCLVVLCSSCATSGEVETLRGQFYDLQEQTNSRLKDLSFEQAQLRKLMEESTGLLSRNSADFGANMERVSSKLARVDGQLDEQRQTIDSLEERLAALATKKKVEDFPDNADDLYKKALTKVAGSAHQTARRMLREFINRYPNDHRVPYAQVKLGDSYYSETKFGPAVQEYKKVLDNYAESRAVPDALYKIGLSFYQLKWCTDADAALTQLIKKHRKHPQVGEAKRLVKVIKTYRTNRRFCTS